MAEIIRLHRRKLNLEIIETNARIYYLESDFVVIRRSPLFDTGSNLSFRSPGFGLAGVVPRVPPFQVSCNKNG